MLILTTKAFFIAFITFNIVTISLLAKALHLNRIYFSKLKHYCTLFLPFLSSVMSRAIRMNLNMSPLFLFMLKQIWLQILLL